MVLKMAHLVKSWESFQTPWNAPNVLVNWFPTTFRLIHEDFLWIPNGPKSTDFEQKAWAIAHGFEDGGFGQVLGIVPNSLKRPQYAWKLISNYFRAHSWRFTLNSEWPEINRFWAKSLGYSPWFWRWRIWSSPGNRSKLPETPPIRLEIHFQLLSGSFMKISCEVRMARNRPILSKKPGL